MTEEFWTTQTCSVCGEGYATESEYNIRHDDGEDGDCHIRCCPVCNSPFALYLVTVGEEPTEADLGKLEVAFKLIGNVPEDGPWPVLYEFCREILEAAIVDRHNAAAELPVMTEEDFAPDRTDE